MSSHAHRQLCAALLRHAAPAQLLDTRERPWASITFSGARHWMTLEVRAPSCATLMRSLPEHDFALRGHFLADLTVTSCATFGGQARLSIEALTVCEA